MKAYLCMATMLTNEERAILKTVAYFDLFSYPLTAFEVWKWLMADHPAPQRSYIQTRDLLLQSEALEQKLDREEGFYFLRGREEIVAIRKERYLLAEKKYRRALHAVRFFRFLPFIKLIAVCNSLGYSNARASSDIDLFLITDPGKIWTVRQLTTVLAALFGWRPTDSVIRDRLCLSFFVSTDALNLRHLALDPNDIYLRYWIEHLVPVWGDPAVLERFRSANAWQREILPNAFGVETAPQRVVNDSTCARGMRRFLGALQSRMAERWYRRLQLRRLPSRLRELANKDTRVVVTDQMLKFHDNDRRREFAERFDSRLQEVTA